ncbi:MAG: undecaprenyl-phosphate glucose phosphotransferase [Hyphomicrobiales bacterium]|nr:undecaprenyl-phosphate glucose phosphotransferase [Hyphomicrobiales bacterium]
MKTVQDLKPALVMAGERDVANWRYLVSLGTALVDFIAVLGIVWATSVGYHFAVYQHMGSFPLTVELAVFIASIFCFTNMLQRRYRLTRHLTSKGQIVEAFNVWNVTMVAFIAIGFLAKVGDNYSRGVIILTYVAGIPLIALARWWVVKIVSIASKTGRIAAQRVLLVGREAEMTSFMTRHQPWNTGLMIQDMVILRQPKPDMTEPVREALLAEDLAHAVAQARRSRPDGVYLAVPWSERDVIERCIDAFMNLPVSINLAPEQVLDRFDNPRIIRIGSIASLEVTPPPLSLPELVIKRLFDLVGAATLLVLLLPVFAVVAILIKCDSKGPVFFMQRRFGFNQQEFRIFKFRTMSTMEDGDVIRQATRNDPRITRFGAWLRQYNIDELPQLINVLLGQMSLVGPRPHALAHDREYVAKISLYARRHNVKPGITGWAQVHGLRGETDTDDKMANRVTYDLWYIDNWNLWLDVAILLRTVLSRKAFSNAH